MIVAGLQTDIAWENPGENFRRVRILAREARDRGARLLVLPELFSTGFTMNTALACAATEEIRAFLAELSRDLDAYVAGGYAEAGDPLPMNVCGVFNPDGEEILHYRKIHPFTLAGEDRHYGAGREVLTTEIEGLRITPVICYDLRFPELYRAAAERTDLYLVIANWPSMRADAWRTLLRARAMENQAFVLGVNRVGLGEDKPHSGDTALLDPFGREIDGAEEIPAVVCGEVLSSKVTDAREHFGFLRDRRPDVYGDL